MAAGAVSTRDLLWDACRSKRCCRAMRIVLTGSDLARLVRAFELEPVDVAEAIPVPEGDGEVARRDDVLCPAGSWGPGSALASPDWRRRAERQFAEYELDAIVNHRWNEHSAVAEGDDPLDAYVSWMLGVYAALDAAPGAPLDWEGPHRGVLAALHEVLAEHPPPAAVDSGRGRSS